MKAEVICYCEWIDPTVFTDWVNVEDVNDNMDILKSFGFLIKETENYLVLSLSIDEAVDKINCAKIIPKSLVKKIKRYKYMEVI